MIAILSFALLIASTSAQLSTFCGGAGYDVSSMIGRQFTQTFNGWTWTLAPCGAITQTFDAACFNDVDARYGSMMCQRNAANTSVYTIANWNTTVAQYGTQWVAIPNGVSMRVLNGEPCGAVGGLWREASIQFVCDATATTPVFVSVTEPETCWYVATIRTSAACSTVGPTMSNQVGSSWWSRQCGGGFYDLSALRTTDMNWDNVDYNYWVRVCANVNEARCSSIQPSSFCQLPKRADGLPLDVSDFNSSVADMYTVTPVGLDIDVKSGAACAGNGLRQATYHLRCNPRATTPILSQVYEGPTCWYHAVIQTSAVCTGTNFPGMGYCGGAGYDLTELQTMDLVTTTTTGTVYNWYLHPCSTLSPWFTGACAGRNSMMCQESNSTKTSYNLASWNRTIAETATWMAITNGVQLYVQTGDMCGALPRDVAIQFICDETARVPRFMNVTEAETCYYVAVVLTEAACDTYTPTAPHLPGSTYQDQACGGNYLDLSEIRDLNDDLVLDTNPADPTQGYLYFVEICGAVNTPRCSTVQPSMFCQVNKNSSVNTYSIARYEENQLIQYTINENGLSMKLQTGTPCGGIPRRAVTINIVCDNTWPAIMSSVREVETCHYAATIRARCDYGTTEPFSTRAPGVISSSSTTPRPSSTGQQPTGQPTVNPTGNPTGNPTNTPSNPSSSTGTVIVDDTNKSSSSGLSGGAIAGIVIGSIVGALVLLAIVFFLCCAGRSGKNSKFNEMNDHRDESQTGELEMESA